MSKSLVRFLTHGSDWCSGESGGIQGGILGRPQKIVLEARKAIILLKQQDGVGLLSCFRLPYLHAKYKINYNGEKNKKNKKRTRVRGNRGRDSRDLSLEGILF